ncbi:MAG: hypothetical protein ACFFBD_01700 [Candidatus Hodarchaeota archaeon]
MSVPGDQQHFLFTQSLLQFLKNNEFRIAVHKYSREESPLSSRSDLKPFCEKVKANPNLDILALNHNKNIVVFRSVINDGLVLHLDQDLEFTNGLNAAVELGLPKGAQFWFVSNGIISNRLVNQELPDNLEVKFLEARLTAKMHNLTDPKIFLRKVVSSIRRLNAGTPYEQTDLNCECGSAFLRGKGVYSFWGKELELNYYICSKCGIQAEDQENSEQIMSFVSGIK